MPLVNIKIMENVFNSEQKKQIIEKITDTMVEVEGESMRPVTWVIIEEVKSEDWGLAGTTLTSDDILKMQGS